MSFYDDASLVLIPSGYKAGKVYSQKPLSTNGELTFTRASHATRVNVNGYVEKARTNSLLQSNTFSTTWATSVATVTGGQSGYDGTSDAWLLDKTAANGFVRQFLSSSLVSNLSIYVKAGTSTFCKIYLRDSVGSNDALTTLNLSTGALLTLSDPAAISHNVEAIGNGWYRFSLSSSGGYDQILIYPADGDNDTSGTSGNIYIQDAQLEQGLVATDYIETTTAAVTVGIQNDVPRLNYPSANGCPSLLLEPQRTNLITNSEYYDGTDWFEGNTTVTTNAATSPENLINASQVDFAAVANANLQRSAPTSVTLGLDYTCTFWARASAPVNNVKLSMDGVDTDLAITTTWTRFTRTVTAAGTTLATTLVTRDSVAVSIELWGFQLEQGSYATSYIPSYGSTVTRSEDSTYKTGISSLIGQTEGTVFFEFDQKLIDQSTTRRLLALTDGTTNNRIVVYISAANKLEYYVRNTTGQLFLSTGVTVGNTTGVHKVAAVYKDGDYAIYMDGAEVASGAGSAGTIPACSRLDVGEQLGANQAYEPFNKVLLFTTRLSNADLATLTT